MTSLQHEEKSTKSVIVEQSNENDLDQRCEDIRREQSMEIIHGGLLFRSSTESNEMRAMVESTTTRVICSTVDHLLQDVENLTICSSSKTNFTDSGSTSTSRQTSTSRTTKSSQGASSKRSRRAKSTSDEGDMGSDREDDDSRRKRPRSGNLRDELVADRRLKCPFYQRQPEKEMNNSCKGNGFSDIAKLK